MNRGNRSRRRFLRNMGLGASVLAMSRAPFAAAKKTKKPNILIVHVDELRIDCLGPYGDRQVKTPHADALARDGVRYDNSFATYPACTPSRYSLISGLYVNEHRGWSNKSTLAAGFESFPKILRKAGYRTKAVGKMHFTPTYLDVGFDELVLSEQDGSGRWDDDYHRYLMKHDLCDRIDLEDQRGEYRKKATKEYWETFGAKVSELPEKHHSTTWVADRAVETLETWDSPSGNLLMVGFIKPHHPFDPPAPWDKMYDPDKIELLPGWTDKCLDRDLDYNKGYFPHEKLNRAALRRVQAYYYATISQIDHHMGRMIDILKKKKIYDDTIVVYTSDHGDYMGFHHILLKANFMYDPVIKVPLIVKWPNSRKAGQVAKNLVSNVDLAPTLLREAGCKIPKAMNGEKLQGKGPRREIVFAESRNGSELMARTQTKKLILLRKNKNLKLFFDLEKDPLEMEDLSEAPEHQADIKKMEKALLAWHTKGSDQIYLNHKETQIKQPNVPPEDLSHRPAVIAYYERKMKDR